MCFARLIPFALLLVVLSSEGETRASGDPFAVTSGSASVTSIELGRRDLPQLLRRAASRKERPSREALRKGVFLVASENLSDPNFSQTVVLLLEYDESGALGLIINRPTEISLASLLPGEEDLKNRQELVFIGGPVGRTQLFLLLRSTSRPRQSEQVVDGVYASTSLTTLREILAQESSVAAFQAYAGYSGWGPGQLDAELLRGDWLITPADSETLFDKATDSIWPELIRKNRGLWVYPAPSTPSSVAISSRRHRLRPFH